MATVLVSIPNLHWIHKTVVERAIRLLQDSRHQVHLIMPTHRPYENNLHHIVHHWMEERDDAWWLNIDADNPPENNPLDLIDLDKDIIGCPTPIYHYGKAGDRPFAMNVFRWDEPSWAYREWPAMRGLQKVDAIGTGCFLVNRRVFESGPAMRAAPFERIKHADGRVEFGNDMAFCRRALDAGFGIWAHFDYCCDHFSEISLTECWRATHEMKAAV